MLFQKRISGMVALQPVLWWRLQRCVTDGYQISNAKMRGRWLTKIWRMNCAPVTGARNKNQLNLGQPLKPHLWLATWLTTDGFSLALFDENELCIITNCFKCTYLSIRTKQMPLWLELQMKRERCRHLWVKWLYIQLSCFCWSLESWSHIHPALPWVPYLISLVRVTLNPARTSSASFLFFSKEVRLPNHWR